MCGAERNAVGDGDAGGPVPGIGQGYGAEIRASVDTRDVSSNTLTHDRAPQLVVGANFGLSGSTLVP
jgi:hypothetical protein